MRIHHLNCGTMCPYGGRLMGKPADDPGPARLTCHCLLLETDRGLVLVDTGLGLEDIQSPTTRLSRFFVGMMRPRLDEDETAVRQIERLGLSPRDVRHIVLTHLDFDHAGGLADFPHAQVHLLADEADAAQQRVGAIARGRYRPQQWSTAGSWQTYSPQEGEAWFGFECVRGLVGLPPELLLIPLVGHTAGHAGVAVQTGEGWLLHAGDAYFYRGELNTDRVHCPLGLRAYQAMMEVDRRARLRNQQRLRDLVYQRRDEVRVLCAHDPVEFEAWAARSPHGEPPHPHAPQSPGLGAS
ncbi:MBL fold metallo-hydrolase [Nannocystis punicea]|uniref:MBL fold metallo-hydrolase n=1 Tax=Nannocystis punicea TaxID=2995304 RepID=A0ABY7H749_9BACT|nr:MBL fold metallo-hydrolase [Nannocystis poenicansa]WAS95099.1 MBL fold metallo-hydrolase [Nannocystis poenicansa]